MSLLFVIGLHAGFHAWTRRNRLIGLAILFAATVAGAALYEFYDVYYFLAGVWRRIVPALIFTLSGYYLGRYLRARRHRHAG